jgi:hypothetical protein
LTPSVVFPCAESRYGPLFAFSGYNIKQKTMQRAKSAKQRAKKLDPRMILLLLFLHGAMIKPSFYALRLKSAL